MNQELNSLNQALERRVTERTLALQESAERFQFLTDTIPQIIWTAQAQGHADYFNRNWYDYSGLTFEQSQAQGWNCILHQEDLAAFRAAWQVSVDTGEAFEEELRMKQAKDQTYRWHLVRALPMKDEREIVTKWFATATDIHDQRLQQNELEKINEELDSFVYMASHDLKAPIGNLEGLLNLLHERGLHEWSEKIQPLFTMMKSQVTNLKDIIHDLSDVGRIQREASADFEVVDVASVYEEFEMTHQELLKETQADIRTDFQQRQLYFSVRLLRSLMHNLLENALKYRTDERQPLIQLKTYQDHEYFVLTVADNGVGIAPEYIPKIFGMFKRFNQDQEGTGIGLYMVKRIAEKYQGRIEVKSQLDQGTIFKVYLVPPLSKTKASCF